MIVQTIEDLERDLKKKPQRAYLIVGPELYLCRQAISLLKEGIVTPEACAFDYSEFSAGAAPIDEIIEAVNTFPMISPKRFIIVSQADKFKEAEQDALLKSLDSMSSRSVLVLYAEELDHRKKFYKTLRDRICVVEFPKLKDIALERWAKSFVDKQGYRISSRAIKKIVEMAGADLQSLASEMEKLFLYAGESKTVPDSAIDDLVRGSRQQSIFELIGAIGRRDRVSALKSLSNLLGMGEHPLVVIVMMARHCRQVLIAKECLEKGSDLREISSAAQIPTFFLEQFLREARSADYGSIREFYIRLAEADKKLKSSAVDGRMLLESMICAFV